LPPSYVFSKHFRTVPKEKFPELHQAVSVLLNYTYAFGTIITMGQDVIFQQAKMVGDDSKVNRAPQSVKEPPPAPPPPPPPPPVSDINIAF